MPANAPSGHCPACLFRIGLALADAGVGFALDETTAAEKPEVRNPKSEIQKVRYIGDYELLEKIADGGMGIVYQARQVSLNRLVALKMIRAGELATEKEVARFRAEAEAAAHLDHPNIVPIYEVGEDKDRHYFSMKLVEGGSLAERMTKSEIRNPNETRSSKPETGSLARKAASSLVPRHSLDLRHSACVISKVARAVHYAHQRGLLHRDLKPGNILLDPHGEPHVTDFGLAKRVETDSSLTVSGAILGTPSYMAPEQAAGARNVTTASDVYSLGAILYELLTGRPPFHGATALDTLVQVREQEPKPPRAFNTHLDRDLETICLKCLEKDAQRRYRSAEALAEDLDRWLAHEPIQARPATVTARVAKWARRKPVVAALAAGVLLVSLLGVAGIVWQWRAALRARAEAQHSARQAAHDLREAQLAQLQLVVGSRRLGHRLDSLRLIEALATDGPSDELRNLAITALGSTDARDTGVWRELPFEPACPPAFDGPLARVALGMASGSVALYTFPDFQSLTTLRGPAAAVGALQWVNADRWLAACFADGSVALWDIASGRLRFATNGCVGPGYGQRVAVHPRGDFLAMAGTGKTVRLFDLVGGQESEAATLPDAVESLAFSPAGDKVALSFTDRLQVREVPSLKLLADDATDTYCANQIVWEPKGRWFYGAMRGWSILTCYPGFGTKGQLRGFGHDAAAVGLSQSADGSLLLSFGRDNVSLLRHARDTGMALALPSLTGLRFADRGTRFACWQRGRGVGVYEAVPSQELRSLSCAGTFTRQVYFSSQHEASSLLATVSPSHAALFDSVTGETLATVELADASKVCFRTDGTRLITLSRAGVQSWPLARGEDRGDVPWKVGSPTLIAGLGTNFVPEGTVLGGATPRLVAAGSARTVVVDLGDEGVRFELPPPSHSAFPVAATDGSWWVYSQPLPEGTWLSRANAPEQRRQLSHVGGQLALSHDGTRLAVAGFSRVECFSTSDWARLWSVPVELPSQHPAPVAFSQDGRWLAASLRGNAADLLEAGTGHPVARFKPPVTALLCGLSFGHEDAQLLVGTIRGLFVWDLRAIHRELAALGLDWQ